MKERARFCVEVEKGEESFSALCRRYGVSRTVGYKWWRRYQADGPAGLIERGKRPHHHPNETPEHVVDEILAVRREHPTWGPRKIVAKLHREQPGLATPVPSTVGEILKRHGMVSPRRRTIRVARSPAPLTVPHDANAVWTLDFKGQFRVEGGRWCWPLTLMDLHSRYLLRCQALGGYRYTDARPVLLSAFQEFGMPWVIRSDNGSPFACRGPTGLSAMAVWFIRLGVRPERIAPGCPTQNGAHERMHRTLKAEATKPRASSLVAQQRRFNVWRRCYNHDRPHESLGQTPPADHFSLSPRPYPRRLRIPDYPDDLVTVRVGPTGEVRWRRCRLYLGRNLGELEVGFQELGDELWRVWFMDHCLGSFDASNHQRQWVKPPTEPVSPPPGPLWR